MENQIVKVDPKEFGLEVEQVSTIEQAFLPKIQEREALVKIYDQLITSELTPELCKEAKEVRLKLVKVRTGISDIHKTQKAFFLSAGRFVDAWKNKETLPVEQMEEKLSEIENYYINIEKAKKAQLQAERLLEVSKYTEFPANALGDIEPQVYDAYLHGLKVAYEAKIEAERLEAERLEAERIAEVARQKAIEEENVLLKAEAKQKEKELAALEAELKAKSDKVAADLKAKEDAEKQAQIEAAKAAKAPRKEKLTIWVNSFEIPTFENDEKANDILTKFEAFKMWAKSEIEKL